MITNQNLSMIKSQILNVGPVTFNKIIGQGQMASFKKLDLPLQYIDLALYDQEPIFSFSINNDQQPEPISFPNNKVLSFWCHSKQTLIVVSN